MLLISGGEVHDIFFFCFSGTDRTLILKIKYPTKFKHTKVAIYILRIGFVVTSLLPFMIILLRTKTKITKEGRGNNIKLRVASSESATHNNIR